MATVYLHIGLPKTGTSAVQNFLWNNKTVLEKYSIVYPDFNIRYPRVKALRNAHFLFSVDKSADNSQPCTDDVYTQILAQIAELGTCFDKIFLTDEALWSSKKDQPAFWEKIKADFAEKGLSLRIIVYLRRQDQFVQSLYRQKVKARATNLSFHEFFESYLKNYPLDYYSYISGLSSILGRDSLIIRVYEKQQYHGKGRNLFSDFLDIFDLSVGDGFAIDQADLNIPLDGTKLELRRILNTVSGPKDHHAILTQCFRDINSTDPHGNDNYANISFFHPEEQAAYMESFAESNSRVAREFLGREDGILFHDNKISTSAEAYHIDNDELLRDTILLYARSVQRFEKENSELKRELEKVRSELHDLKESAVLYRLKRKINHLSERKGS